MKIKPSELPNRFRLHYKRGDYYQYEVCLLKLGSLIPSGNPYFGTQERQVENQIVRYLGKRPSAVYARLGVERADGTVWDIYLSN
ncbi:MAG: hypothetical protein RSA41_06280, partial [Christensenella sp.]